MRPPPQPVFNRYVRRGRVAWDRACFVSQGEAEARLDFPETNWELLSRGLVHLFGAGGVLLDGLLVGAELGRGEGLLDDRRHVGHVE